MNGVGTFHLFLCPNKDSYLRIQMAMASRGNSNKTQTLSYVSHIVLSEKNDNHFPCPHFFHIILLEQARRLPRACTGPGSRLHSGRNLCAGFAWKPNQFI